MLKSAAAVKRILRPPQVRGANRAAILSLLQHTDSLSRADVSRQSGLSEGAISRIVTSLIEDGLVREDGAENPTGGRPGRRLALEPRCVLFGAEIQNWETRCAVCTMHGRVVETLRFRTPATADETLQSVVSAFQTFRRKFGSRRLPGIGIAARGIVNSDSGVLVLGSRPEWRNIPVRDFLESRLAEPVIVENNVRAAALAEYTYGPAAIAGPRCFVFVKVDEGVGMGVLFDGKLYHGPHMAAGELGQIVVEMAASKSASNSSKEDQAHNRPGSLEQLVSNPAVCQRYSRLNTATRIVGPGDTSARVRRIAELANSGDSAARQTLQETARYLGVGISNIVWAFDADTIVLDAAITENWQLVEPILRKHLPGYREMWGSRDLPLRPSAFSGEAALIGACTLPLSLIFAGKAALHSSALPA